MRLQETIAFYLLVGLGVAAAMLLNTRRRTMLESLLQELAAMLFWPMYLPLLLSQPAAKTAPTETPISPRDEMAMAIARVNSELDSALSSLDGWAESVLISERSRLVELRAALVAHAARIRSMDLFLAENDAFGQRPGGIVEKPERHNRSDVAASETVESASRRQASELALVQNIARLAEVRRQSYDDLMATLAWIRELVSMIHLAKFTGAPASRAEELVAQIAAAVEGISVVAAEPNGHARSKRRSLISDSLEESVANESFPELQHIPVPPIEKNRSIDKWASSSAPAT